MKILDINEETMIAINNLQAFKISLLLKIVKFKNILKWYLVLLYRLKLSLN